MMDEGPRFVVIYGPPAAGKLTVAKQLSQLTGFKLFHNHLTVNLVRSLFEFGSTEFNRTLWKVRLDLVTEAARSGANVILTLNSAHGPNSKFLHRIAELENTVNSNGGRVLFVHLEPSREVLHARLTAPERAVEEKLMDPDRLNELLEHWDSQPAHVLHLSIDNSHLAPEVVAKAIMDHYQLDSFPEE